MRRILTMATAGVAALFTAMTINVAAQDFNTQERTFLTFSAPVELPGVTLQPGTYVFRLADTPSRNVVQVLANDEKDIIGQWLFVQAQRPDVTGETVITFKETREGAMPAVQYWYYPGEKIGKEFIYPKEQAMRIAQRTGADVRSDDGVVNGSGMPAATAQVAVADTTVVEQPAAAAPMPMPTPMPAPAETTVATGSYADNSQAVGTSGVQQESTTARNELPATASPLALAGLLGLLSLAGAAGIRKYRG